MGRSRYQRVAARLPSRRSQLEELGPRPREGRTLMNKLSFADFRQSLLHHGRLRLRVLDMHRRATAFSHRNDADDALRRI
jgi:hypothetical protein